MKPEVAGRVSSISMGFTDTSEVSHLPANVSTVTSGELFPQSHTSADNVDDEFDD